MDLREMLDAVLASESDHARRLVKCAAIVSEALRREGLEATVVGGSAIEIHAPEAYVTSDLDLVVAERFSVDWSVALERTFRTLGFERKHRHWVRDDMFVEIPSRTMSDPVVVVETGLFPLRVVTKEVVLADRVVGFKYWGVTEYALQAVAMLRSFGPDFDEDALCRRLDRENARDAYMLLLRLSAAPEPITHEGLQAELETLRGPSR